MYSFSRLLIYIICYWDTAIPSDAQLTIKRFKLWPCLCYSCLCGTLRKPETYTCVGIYNTCIPRTSENPLHVHIIITVIIISFMQGIYIYIPETNYVPGEYSVAAILLLLFMVLILLVSVLNLLYFYISIFRIMCAVPSMAVFYSSLTSWFPVMLLTYFLNDFEIVPLLLLLLLLLLSSSSSSSSSLMFKDMPTAYAWECTQHVFFLWFYHRSCHGMSRRTQDFFAMKL